MNVRQLRAVEGQKRLVIVFSSGEEMVRGLTALARDEKLFAAHFTGIGALRSAILGYFDVTRREYRGSASMSRSSCSPSRGILRWRETSRRSTLMS